MRELEPKDLRPLPLSEGVRPQFRAEAIAARQARRSAFGPFASPVVENRLTVNFQVQEFAGAERIPVADSAALCSGPAVPIDRDRYNHRQELPDAVRQWLSQGLIPEVG